VKMSEEEIVFQLLEEDRRLRLERRVEERKITTDDCLVLGILRLHREIDGLHEEIGGLHTEIVGVHKRIDDTNARIDDTNAKIDNTNALIEELRIDMNRRIDSNFKWTVSLILGTWASMMAILIPILLKVVV
jgi:predicted  nucleic acid-binding Zn-ribbon protein